MRPEAPGDGVRRVGDMSTRPGDDGADRVVVVGHGFFTPTPERLDLPGRPEGRTSARTVTYVRAVNARGG